VTSIPGAMEWMDEFMPPRGECAMCGGPDARHRLTDAMIGRVKAGDHPHAVAEDYGYPEVFVRRLMEWDMAVSTSGRNFRTGWRSEMAESREAVTSRPIPFQFSDPEWPGLAKLAEECAEVVQVVMKIVGTGGTLVFKDGQTVERSLLIEEMGDVVAALRFVQTHALTIPERDELHRRANAKLTLFEHWRSTEAS
jgi:hypothetical protein